MQALIDAFGTKENVVVCPVFAIFGIKGYYDPCIDKHIVIRKEVGSIEYLVCFLLITFCFVCSIEYLVCFLLSTFCFVCMFLGGSQFGLANRQDTATSTGRGGYGWNPHCYQLHKVCPECYR